MNQPLTGFLQKLRYVRQRGLGTLVRDFGFRRLLSALRNELDPTQRIHSMLTAAEANWARKYVRSHFKGRGQIVDLGCWMGSSTIALAKGLRANRRASASNRLIHAYDEFIWRDWMGRTFAGTGLGEHYEPGESFLSLFERQTEKWRDLIEVHQGDITHEEWIGEPIEFLFVDVMKNWKLTNTVVRKFFGQLVPGVSVVQHQDYAHLYAPWIPLTMYRLRDYFEPVCFIDGSSSMVFRSTAQIPESLLSAECNSLTYSDEECEAAYESALSLVDQNARSQIWLAHIMMLAYRGELDRAEQKLDSYTGRFGDSSTAVKNVRIRIDECRRSPWRDE